MYEYDDDRERFCFVLSLVFVVDLLHDIVFNEYHPYPSLADRQLLVLHNVKLKISRGLYPSLLQRTRLHFPAA